MRAGRAMVRCGFRAGDGEETLIHIPVLWMGRADEDFAYTLSTGVVDDS